MASFYMIKFYVRRAHFMILNNFHGRRAHTTPAVTSKNSKYETKPKKKHENKQEKKAKFETGIEQ